MTQREPVKLHPSQIRFIGEQDGAVEQEFKGKLKNLLQGQQSVSRAYLALVDYGTAATFTVALCLRASSSPDTGLVNAIGDVFASIFSSAEHLDILFLDEDQEKRLIRLCRPFYEISTPNVSMN